MYRPIASQYIKTICHLMEKFEKIYASYILVAFWTFGTKEIIEVLRDLSQKPAHRGEF